MSDDRPESQNVLRSPDRPLRGVDKELTPRTSYGFAVIHFAATVLAQPLDPWQQWLVIHLGEMLEDGRPPCFSLPPADPERFSTP